MKVVYSDLHRLHHGRGELIDGRLRPCVETPRRAEILLRALRDARLGPLLSARAQPRSALAAVHSETYLEFLETAWAEWVAEHGDTDDALPLIWPNRGLRQIEPRHIDGRLSYYSMDAGTPITAGTWPAAVAAAEVALGGCDCIAAGAPAVFSLCRPPGHHAGRDLYGGYCYLNNAAIAAESYLERGADRIALLDLDYHHGNGSQSIFYRRADVLFVSLHADPAWEYPYFLGYAEERGEGPGAGYNLNYPLPPQSDFARWRDALGGALAAIRRHAPDVLVVSLGLDTYEGDPICGFRLRSEDYRVLGADLAKLRLATHFVLEGGYALEALGDNLVRVLAGFSAGG